MKRSGNRCVLIVDSELVRPYLSLPRPWAPESIRDWSQLDEAVPAAAPSCCILVDPFAHGPAPLLDFLARFPSATVVAASRLAPGRIVDLRRMLHAGVSDLVDLSEPWPVELLGQVLEDTLARPLKRRIEGLLSRYVSLDARTIIHAAAEIAVTGGGAGELASRLGISEPTVTHWCRKTALPPPRRLQAWLRVLLAAQLLDDSGRSVRNVSLACGYLAEKSLRRVMRRFVGLDTRMLRKQGAFKTSILAFNQELRTLREQRRSGRQAASRVVVPMAADDVTVPAREAPRAGDAGLFSPFALP